MPRYLKRLIPAFLVPAVLALGFVSVCYANAPPPPAVFIIVPDAPGDLALKIDTFNAIRKDKVFESYFAFYSPEGGFQAPPVNAILQVTTGNVNYQVSIPKISRYSNIFTLNLAKRTLTTGGFTLRAYEFGAITVILTLLVEGIIFYLFGYRKKSSWITFVVTNLLTQGFLYFMLTTSIYPSFYNYASSLDLVFGEFWVFVIEIAAFLVLINERPRWQTFLYVLAANFASLFAGSFIIGNLI